ncbi:pyocin knob domain-containing protein [Pseudarcicella hirudinis]|uniref:pyocin knob domain-containing protein n=1 Tax=Pseudarcicella hirudinis TaxID=1079859 RepID=UPI0035EFA41B
MLDSGAMPTTGSFTAGDTIMNDTPSILTLYGVKYVIQGWKRITTGSNHVLGTDWFAMPAVDPTGIIAIQTISDLNSLSVAGWFKTTVNPTNAPAGSSPTAFFQGIQFLSNGDPNYINQLVFDTSGNEYKRTKSAGAWGSWYKVSSRLEGTTAQRNAIISPAEGQDFYNTETHAKEYWNGTVWKTLTTN